MNLATSEKKLQGKLKLLKLLNEDTQTIIDQRNLEAIEGHLSTIRNKLSEVQDLKVSIQELKFEDGKDETDIRTWSAQIGKDIKQFQGVGTELREIVKEMKQEEAEREDRIKQEQRINLEKEIEKIKFEEKLNYEKQLEELHSKTSNPTQEASKVNLPKLIITKFNGTFTDWFRFWNQYEAEIDSSDISPVSKFSYLKELVITPVRANIDALTLTSEGYERAKQILKAKYGKPSEVVNAFVQNIMSLPHIRGTNPSKIHDFYGKLASSVQALEVQASACCSQNSCQKCGRRHHTSVCDSSNKSPTTGEEGREPILVATGSGKVVYPVVVVRVNGIKCRALLDTGAGSSYASSVLLQKTNSRPARREKKRIEMMMESCNKRIDIHKVTICSLGNDFRINTEVTKVDRDKLLTLENPQYQQKINQYAHLQGISMNDDDSFLFIGF